MSARPFQRTLRRFEVRELFASAWVRVFHHQDSQLPEWFIPGLREAKPATGFGVLDPLEILVEGSRMTLVGAGKGRTLLEYLGETFSPEGDVYIRNLIEQLCYGVSRIHDGVGTVHGALTPANICTNEDFMLNLWSVPTARLELSLGWNDEKWEAPYRSPQVLNGETPTIADDVFSLGMLLMRFLCGTPARFDLWLEDRTRTWDIAEGSLAVVDRCLQEDRERRFGSVCELAATLQPETRLIELDIEGARGDQRLALRAFLEKRYERAIDHWKDAIKKDWLNFSYLNNLAVCRIALEDWEALFDLEKALRFHSFHPLVETNIGLCHAKRGETAAAEFWLERAFKVNPSFHQSRRTLAQISKESGAPGRALRHAQAALAIQPQCGVTRRLISEILRAVGEAREADAHESYAARLPKQPAFLDHLILDDSPPPWMLRIGSQGDRFLERFELKGDSEPFDF